MLNDFPAKSTECQSLILDLLDSPRCFWNFTYLKHSENNNNITLEVLDDALKIDGIRVNVSAHTQQIIANRFGCLLLTAKISDLIYQKADVKVTPCPRPISATTKDAINHSRDVDKKISSRKGLISTVGKDWIIVPSWHGTYQNQAVNHGWHFEGDIGIKGTPNPSLLKASNGQYFKCIQWLGYAHDSHHVDYSQVCRLVNRSCNVNGKVMDLVDVLKDPELSKLVSHNGPILNPYQVMAPVPDYVFNPLEPKRSVL